MGRASRAWEAGPGRTGQTESTCAWILLARARASEPVGGSDTRVTDRCYRTQRAHAGVGERPTRDGLHASAAAGAGSHSMRLQTRVPRPHQRPPGPEGTLT